MWERRRRINFVIFTKKKSRGGGVSGPHAEEAKFLTEFSIFDAHQKKINNIDYF